MSLENKECILTGDINCNFLANSDHKELKSIVASFGLKQLIRTPTRIMPESQTLTDVICSNEPHHICCTKVIPAGLNDHELIGCARKLHDVKYQPRVITCRNYANYNPQLFCDDLRSKDFGNVFASSCVNRAWSFLKNTLQQCIDKHAPLIEKKVKGRLRPWLTPYVKREMNLRDKMLRKARRTSCEVDWSSYKQQRNRVTGLIKNAKNRYHRELLNNNVDSPDKFWSAIKKLYPTKSPSEPGSALLVNGTKTTDKKLIANTFCNYFSNVARLLKSSSFLLCDFIWSRPTQQNYLQPVKTNFLFKEVHESQIYKELRNLKRKKATGLDNFPPGLLKDAALVIAKPLTYIINLSLRSGTVPPEWKEAKVLPLFKSGSSTEIGNYRPISLLPILSKILEKVVYSQLVSYLESNNLLPDNQFGFRS